MIDFYYFMTPNGHKISIFLEEAELEYKVRLIDISKGEQFAPDFLAIAPNNRIPAIVDHQPLFGNAPFALFESGAILEYLAEKTGKFLPPPATPERYEVLQWLHWQIGGLGPMAGQNHHFRIFAPEPIPYAIKRYTEETKRLYTVLETRLQNREWIGASYSIADIACFPWVAGYERQGIHLQEFPNISRWFHAMNARQAVHKALALAEQYSSNAT